MANTNSSGILMKTGIFAALAAVFYFLFNFFSGKKTDAPTANLPENPPKTEQTDGMRPAKQHPEFEISPSEPAFYEPSSTTGAIVRHTWFSLSYSEDHEQAEWVAYELTRERLNANFAERTNIFRPDPEVKTESATPHDYSGGGFDKGHLCPAADMGFDEKAMDETFYMSNISPQKKAFNTGIWRELEENTRDWARKFRHVYVITGPILSKPMDTPPLGFSKVTVPAAFYKVILAGDKGIAFLIPNEKSDLPLMDYAVTIDRAEAVTGLDFFPKMLTGLAEETEARLDKSAWAVDEKRFARRVGDWNLAR